MIRSQGTAVWLVAAAALVSAMVLSACSSAPRKAATTPWDAYYADLSKPRAHVVVVPPEGTTLPMAKLIADYVAKNLRERKISAQVGKNTPGKGRHFILTGTAETATDPRVRYKRVMRWVLTDAGGRVIATHAHGIDGTQAEWDYGSARVLEAIGVNTAGPVAEIVLAETRTPTPIDPLERGLLVETVQGLPGDAGGLVADAVKDALRTSDVLVTGDPRQAAFRLTGRVDSQPAADGGEDVRITWQVTTLDGQDVGQAVQENHLSPEQVRAGWAALAGRVGQAAAVGVEHIFGVRAGPAPGAPNRATGEPPAVVLPGVPGRAPPPPQ